MPSQTHSLKEVQMEARVKNAFLDAGGLMMMANGEFAGLPI